MNIGDQADESSEKWKATEDYNCGGAPGLLSLTEGELVMKIEQEKEGWVRVKNTQGQMGLVPLKSLGIDILLHSFRLTRIKMGFGE